MSVKIPLKNYHHIVIVAKNVYEAVCLWSKVFHFPTPRVTNLGPIFHLLYNPEYPSLIRGKFWENDYKQAVFNQHSFFFEINEAGTNDNFAEFMEKHGSGVAYIGLIAGEDREAFLERLEKEYGCETVIEQYFPGGDWSVNYAEKVLGIDLCVKKLPGGDHTVNPVMPDFTGMTILVDDLDEKLIGWKELLNVEKIERIIETKTVSYRSEKCDVTIKAAEISDGLFPIYLVEAGENGPFTDYYKAHGNSVFHIAIPAEGEFRETAVTELRMEGFKELLSYELFGKDFVVYDTVDRMGANIALA